ncbi:hypothetical protein SYNPS1DRAFT_27599 [Syncephalis pseudoplumigaleata]|uniref:Uncharacterized protein n=1 Tax=Syncephalis pseudoplumigaleata TaxID=1712513 RepID=A0A4P9Z2K4_9FUNG|nr:hypothetical protein SYNPS1DRAFT_27599 [Syncephalis pseudoplumigaleata]|eukprot:RKP26724.1 hypothetical protein SYNPS1DRAFT_27599 [Syncephalis pseudoplumigaleata]
MWVYPAMTGSLVRSVWKTVRSSDDPFLLQRNDAALSAHEEAATAEGGTTTHGKRRATITAGTSPAAVQHGPHGGNGNTAAAAQASPRNPIYRIITRNFPHYRVAEAMEWNDILEDLEQLQQTVLPRIEGKLTSKKVVKWLRNWHLHGESILPTRSKHPLSPRAMTNRKHTTAQLKDAASQANEPDEAGYVSSSESSFEEEEEEEEEDDARYSSGTQTRIYPRYPPQPVPVTATSTATGSSSGTIKNAAAANTDQHQPQDVSLWDTLEPYTRWMAPLEAGLEACLSPGRTSMDVDVAEDEFNASALSPAPLAVGNHAQLDAQAAGGAGRKRAQTVPGNNGASPLASMGIEQLWEFPLQFVALLTMPDVEGRPSYQALRDQAQVRQRRRVLFFFTLFILLVRYCSFDLFILVLFASNCGMLFLMKNSRRVNVTLAKRSVRQRVNWAKQWMGGLIRHRGNNNNNNNGSNNGSNLDLLVVPATPSASSISQTAPATPSMGSKAIAVRRKLRLRGRNSDAATTSLSVGNAVTRAEENTANGDSISDPSPPNKRSTARHSFNSANGEDVASLASLQETTTATATTATTTTATTTVARQVVASATSATAKRLAFFRTRSPSNAADKPAITATATNNHGPSAANAHPPPIVPPSPKLINAIAPHIQHHQQQQSHQRSQSATTTLMNGDGTSTTTTTTGTRRRFLFGRSTPTTVAASAHPPDALLVVESTQPTGMAHSPSTTSTDSMVATNSSSSHSATSNTSLPLISAS